MDDATIQLIQDQLRNCLLDLDFKEEDITIKSRHSKYAIQEIITIKNKGLAFQLNLKGRLLSDAFEDVRKPDWKWTIKLLFQIENPYKISLTIDLKTFKQKIRSWFSKRPLETYNKAFDKVFSIQSDPIYAYASILDVPIQTKLLQNISYFGQLRLLENEIHYTQDMRQILNPSNLHRIQDLITISLLIHNNLQLWQPQDDS